MPDFDRISERNTFIGAKKVFEMDEKLHSSIISPRSMKSTPKKKIKNWILRAIRMSEWISR